MSTKHTDSVESVVEDYLKQFPECPQDLVGCVLNQEAVNEFNKARLRGAEWLRTTLQATHQQQVEEAVRTERERCVDTIKANVPLERIPSDVQNTKKLIDEFMKLHYEPEHEEGQTCWCSPITTVEPTTKKAYIDHQEQRVILRQFVEDNFVSKEEAIASLCLGSNQARRGVLNAIQALTPNHQD